MVVKGAGDKELARREAAEGGSVQGDMTKSTNHNE